MMWRHRVDRRIGERGATLVEFGFVMPFIALLTFGLCDGALLFNGVLGVQNSARDAARAIQAEGATFDADAAGLRRATSSSGFASGSVDHIYVWHAADAHAPEPSCVSGSTSVSGCNVYVPSDAKRPQTDYLGSAWTAPSGWPGESRATGRDAGADYIGVTVVATVRTPFGVFGSRSKTVKRSSVVRLEATHQ